MEITLENTNILVMLGCERDIFAEKAKGNITIYITSNTNIDEGRLEKFAKLCHNKKQGCKIILKREESKSLYSSEKLW